MAVATVATALCCVAKVWADVTVFADEEFWLTFGLVVAVPVTVWFVLVIVAGLKYARWWPLGILVPVLIAVTVVLAEFSVPGRIGWLLTRSDMDRAAVDCGALQDGGGAGTPGIGTIGVYEFRHVESGPAGACEFFLAKDYPGVRRGFVYLPNGEVPVSDIDHEYVELGDSWYYFTA